MYTCVYVYISICMPSCTSSVDHSVNQSYAETHPLYSFCNLCSRRERTQRLAIHHLHTYINNVTAHSVPTCIDSSILLTYDTKPSTLTLQPGLIYQKNE